MSQVALSKDVLEWALKRQGLTKDDLLKKFPKLASWLDGSLSPSLRQLETLAKATRTPLGYFFLENPPQDSLPIKHFRTINDALPGPPSPDLLETVQLMQQRQAWAKEYLIEEGSEALTFVGSSNLNDSPKLVAQKIRQALKISEGWASKQETWTKALGLLRESMEESGILVVVNGIVGNNTHRKLKTDEFRGFVLADPYAPLVFVNGSDGKAAQMFTLAHELAHVFLGKSAAFDLRDLQAADDPSEQACNRVAAEFLIPEDEFKELWIIVRQTPDSFQRIARHFKVSTIVAARRALDTGVIGRNEFFSFYKKYLSDEKNVKSKKSSGGDFYASQNLRIGRKFGQTVIRAIKEGKLLYSDAYHLTGLSGRSFSRFVKAQDPKE